MTSAFESWLATAEAEFWKAHNEVMDATGIRHAWESLTSTSPNSTPFLETIRTEYDDFVNAVNWSEPVFRYLVGFHVVVALCVFAATRGAVSDERLIAVCVVLTTAVLAGFGLNKAGSHYASSIFVEPNVNYFTEDGVFIAVVYMAPLILWIVVLQIRMAYRLVRLMVQVKGAQLRQRLRREAKAQAQACDAASEAAKKQQ